LERGREYQADLHEMRQKIAYQKEEWRDFGHELTVQHGTEQVERTRARIAESLEVKAEAGRQVKIETDVNNKAIRNERITNLEQKHKYVEALKREKIGKLEESLQYMYEQKRGMVDEVRRVEDKWSSLTKAERDSFLIHAHQNHEKNDSAKEHMRASRKDLIKKNHAVASTERARKEEDAVAITKKKHEEDLAKKAVRDGVYSHRWASPEKTRVMRQASRSKSPQKIARDAGLVVSPLLPDAPSPYRM